MDIYEVRKQNAQKMVDINFDGVKAHFADAIKTSRVVVNRWFAVSEPQKRNIGSNAARKIEISFGLPSGWMDQHHENFNDLEQNAQKRAALKLRDGEAHFPPLRQAAAIDKRMRLTLLDQREGTLMMYSTDDDAYALQLRGHNPELWLSDGWGVLVEPNTPIAENEYALLWMDSGEMLLLGVVYISDELLILRNPVSGAQENIPRSRITKTAYAYVAAPPSKFQPA